MTLNEKIQEMTMNNWRAYNGWDKLCFISKEVNYQIGTMGYNDKRVIRIVDLGTGVHGELRLTMKNDGTIRYSIVID